MAKRKKVKSSPKSTKKKKRAANPPSTLLGKLKGELQNLAELAENVFSSVPKDITAAIEEDHKALRNFLGVLKDTDEDMALRRRAYDSFSALLKSHSTSEEKAVYGPSLKLPGHEMQIKLAEGYVEHHLADDLMKRMDKAMETVDWSAHANVLSETVEHHLREEERDLLPMIRKTASVKLNQEMLNEFVSLRRKTQKRVSKRNAGVLESVAN